MMGASEHLGKRFGRVCFEGGACLGEGKASRIERGERFVSWERSFSG